MSYVVQRYYADEVGWDDVAAPTDDLSDAMSLFRDACRMSAGDTRLIERTPKYDRVIREVISDVR